MKNPILELMHKQRNGNYCHAIEVNEVFELENIAESVIQEFSDKFTSTQIIEFLETLSVYYIGDDETVENEVYDFSFTDYIGDTI